MRKIDFNCFTHFYVALLLVLSTHLSAQPGSTPTSAVDLLTDQIDILEGEVAQLPQQAQLSLTQAAGQPDLYGEAEKLLETIETANQAQEKVERMEELLDIMNLSASIDIREGIYTHAEINAIKAQVQQQIDAAKAKAREA